MRYVWALLRAGSYGRVLGAVFALALVLSAGSVFATEPTECTALSTPATATLENAVTCVFAKVDIGGTMALIVKLFVPVILMIWGARGGFALAANAVRRVIGFVGGRA